MSALANESVYSEEEKQIFQYHNGKEKVWGDPLAIRHRLYGQLPRLQEVMKECVSKDQSVAADALIKLADAVRVAFDMPCNPKAKSPAEYGATHEQCIVAVKEWLMFCKKKEMSTATSPTS